LAFTACRVRAACARNSAARLSAAAACPLSDEWRPVSSAICITLKIVRTIAIAATIPNAP
jgi:hypothetical protein